jgi:pSer/pThr/pTyr-binding forkhead associated (FHA) protein
MPSGERIELRDKPLTIGRLSDSDLTLPDHNVSRRHAEIRRVGNGYALVDLGSTNGTMVNGERISNEHRLQDGDILSIGSIHVRFEAS